MASWSNRQPLLGRIWSGRTRREDADDYLAYLYENGVVTIERKPGNLGVQLFRTLREDVAEFTTISYWPSAEAMKAMHEGDDTEVLRVAHVEREPDYLLELPEYVELTELHANDWPGAAD